MKPVILKVSFALLLVLALCTVALSPSRQNRQEKG